MSGRIVAAVFAGALLVPALLPLMSSQPVAAAPGGNGNGNGNGGSNGNGGNGNGNGGNPHNTTTTTCAYPSNNCPTTTTSRHGHRPFLLINLTIAAAGQTINVVVCGYDVSSGPALTVRITFDGQVIATITIPPGATPPAACFKGNFALPKNGGAGHVLAALGPVGGALAQTSDPGPGGQATFPVPAAALGTHQVCAVATGFDTPCTDLTVVSATSSNGNANNSFLAFTGMGLVRLLLLAGALIAMGWYLVRRSPARQA
jgi:hypothetical protein